MPEAVKSLFPVALLAGGLATRLQPITKKIPKSLIEVAGKPFIHHQLSLLHREGVRRVVVCAGHLGEMIRDSIGNGGQFGLDVAYSFDGPTPLGTAGALTKAREQLGSTFFVLYGDSYLTCNYAAVAAAFTVSGRAALMTVFENKNQYDASNVSFRDGRIVAYSKKHHTPEMRWIDYGLGVLRSEALDGIPQGEFRDLADVYDELLAKDQLAGFEVKERFYEIGSFAGLEELRKKVTEEDNDRFC